VSIVRGVWNAPWFDELEVAFAGGAHDDQADSASGAFAELCGGKVWPWISPPGSSSILERIAPPSPDEDAPRPAPRLHVAASPGGAIPMGYGIHAGRR
jgi:hypothetical protein